MKYFSNILNVKNNRLPFVFYAYLALALFGNSILFLFYNTYFPTFGISTFFYALLVEISFFLCLFMTLQHLSFHLPRMSLFFSILLFYLKLLLFTFFCFTKSHLDYSVIDKNFELIFTKEFLKLIDDFIPLPLLFAITILLGIGSYWFQKNYSFFRKIPAVKPNWKFLIIPTCLSCFFFFGLNSRLSGERYFLASIVHDPLDSFPKNLEANTYPFYKHGPPVKEIQFSQISQNPHIFIIMMESFNANFINKTSDQGLVLTPFFDSLIKESVYIRHFYNNSVQTIRSQISTICGILPSFSTKISYKYPKIHLRCLSDILKERGYANYFFKAHDNIHFDNTYHFFKQRSFDAVKGMSKEFITDTERAENSIHWGIEDQLFYRKFFTFLDKQIAKGILGPYFSVLTSVTNHMMFDQIPAKYHFIHKNPQNTKEHYENSVHLSDRFLRQFFDSLKERPKIHANSIVIVMGDHSFPIGEHDNFQNQVGAYEESFRTPFILLDFRKKIRPRIIKKHFFSQLDIAPTILDLLKLKTDHHFIGTSFLSIPKDFKNTIFVSQPYNGTYLGVIENPFKLIHQLTKDTYYLFDLKNDPQESLNLAKDPKYSYIMSQLKEKNLTHYLNEITLQQNQFAPTEKDPLQ